MLWQLAKIQHKDTKSTKVHKELTSTRREQRGIDFQPFFYCSYPAYPAALRSCLSCFFVAQISRGKEQDIIPIRKNKATNCRNLFAHKLALDLANHQWLTSISALSSAQKSSVQFIALFLRIGIRIPTGQDMQDIFTACRPISLMLVGLSNALIVSFLICLFALFVNFVLLCLCVELSLSSQVLNRPTASLSCATI